MSEVGRPHRLWQAYGDRRETEVKKRITDAGIRNIYWFWNSFLPTPDFGLLALGPKFPINITEP